VASLQRARTLPSCLDSLPTSITQLRKSFSWTTFDGRHRRASWPTTPAAHDHQPNMGLSAARNTGIPDAAGEIARYRQRLPPDEDWLYYLIGDCSRPTPARSAPQFSAARGNPIAGCVAFSPGRPAHVMLDDRNAEHIPAVTWPFGSGHSKRHTVRRAVSRGRRRRGHCWRLLQRGARCLSHRGFCLALPVATPFTPTEAATGYGVAESLLRPQTSGYFNSLGGMRWRGRIYSPSKIAGSSQIRDLPRHFGSALFPNTVHPEPSGLLTLLRAWMACSCLRWVRSARDSLAGPVAVAGI